MLGTCKVENMMDSWAGRNSVKNGSDSSGRNASHCGTVGALIFLSFFYVDFCSKCFLLSLAMCIVSVLCLVVFSYRGIAFK